MQELQDMRKFWPYTIQQNFSANQGVRPDLLITDPGPSFRTPPRSAAGRKIPNNRTPYSEQWNFTVQRQLMDDMTLDVGYVGNVNKRQVGYDPINSARHSRARTTFSRAACCPLSAIWMAATTNSIPCTIRIRVNLVKRFSKGLQLNAQLHLGPLHDQ